MKKTNLEFKVGLFVFTAIAVLCMLIFKTGDFYVKPGYRVSFVFDFVSGVDQGSPVRLAGVNVGEVVGIKIFRNANGATRAEVTCRIQQGIPIEDDADVRINTLGLLGEKYVEILPGTTGNTVLTDGGVVDGKNPILLEKITESGNRLLNKIEKTVDNLNEIVADPKFKDSVKGTFSNAESVAKNLQETTDDLRDAAKSARIVLGRLRDGQGTVGKLLKDDTMARDLEAFVADIKAHPWKLLKKK